MPRQGRRRDSNPHEITVDDGWVSGSVPHHVGPVALGAPFIAYASGRATGMATAGAGSAAVATSGRSLPPRRAAGGYREAPL